MQLAEVFEKTQGAVAPPTPKRRRWLLWLCALAALGGALAVHGPGVTRVPADTALVITNDTGLALFGPPARVARRSAGFAAWVPIAQHAWRLSLRRHRPDAVAFPARTADGATLPLRNATLAYRINPDRADQVFLKYGHKTRGWDAAARAELALAWATVIAERTAAELAATTPDALRPAVRRALEARLTPRGFIVEAIAAARWQAPSAIEAGLAERRIALTALLGAREAAAQAIAEGADADGVLQQRWDTARAAELAILDAHLEGARMQAAAELDEARRDAQSALVAARSERASLFTRAQVIDATAPSDAEALAARAAALAEHGGRLLDEAILTHVLPQIDGAKAPPVDEDAP